MTTKTAAIIRSRVREIRTQSCYNILPKIFNFQQDIKIMVKKQECEKASNINWL